MKEVPVDEALGMTLAYDTTLVTKDGASVLLQRGMKLAAIDIKKLKDSGVYIVRVEDGAESKDVLFEWEITLTIAKSIVDTESIIIVQGRQGASKLYSSKPGLLEVNVQALIDFNLNQKVLLITKDRLHAVGQNDFIGMVEIIPFSMQRSEVERLTSTSKPIVSIIPFKYRNVGVVITGTEIYEGRKGDLYYDLIKDKCTKYGWDLVYKEIVPDDENKIEAGIRKAIDAGSEALIVTGGMSVDLTDRTPIAIANLGANIIAYGVPIKPTTMTVVAELGAVPLLGISAGGIYYSDFNSIDLLFTKLMAGMKLTRGEIAALGHGGISYNFKVV
ncbi:MAG: molybdopterin-binding protein [Conexivisphaerales archaeon]